MARQTFAAKKAKIQKEMERLKKQIEILENRNRQPAIDSIVKTMKEFEITPEEIALAFSKGSRTGAKARAGGKSAGAVRKPVAPKYRNPETGKTWTGRGKAPLWISEAEQRGQSRDTFLIPQ